jgi:SAM-dependent methyltransferase
MKRALSVALFAFCVMGLPGPECADGRDPDVHFVATPQAVVLEMLKVAKVTSQDVVYDLGCGDGRTVITAAKLFGARGVGVDIDPERIKESTENAVKAGVTDRVRFVLGDLFTMDMSEATVVFLYLLPDLNEQLKPKLLRELKPGSRVISHEFDMGSWKPDDSGLVRNVEIYYSPKDPSKKDTLFYYWVVPADASGSWRFSLPASRGKRNYTLRVVQQYQELSGSVNAGGWEVPIDDAGLTGDQLSFTLKEDIDGKRHVIRFDGRIREDTIEGTAQVQGGTSAVTRKWTARRGR